MVTLSSPIKSHPINSLTGPIYLPRRPPNGSETGTVRALPGPISRTSSSPTFSPFSAAVRHHGAHPIPINDIAVNNNRPIIIRSVVGRSALSVRNSTTTVHHLRRVNYRVIHIAIPDVTRTGTLTSVHGVLRSACRPIPLITSIRRGNVGVTLRITGRISGIHVGPNLCIFRGPRTSHANCARRRFSSVNDGVHSALGPLMRSLHSRNGSVHVNIGRNSLTRQVLFACNSAPRNVIRSTLRFLRVYRSLSFHGLIVSVGTSQIPIVLTTCHLVTGHVSSLNVSCPLRLNIARTNSNRCNQVGSATNVTALLTRNVNSAVHISLARTPRGRVPIYCDVLRTLNLQGAVIRCITYPSYKHALFGLRSILRGIHRTAGRLAKLSVTIVNYVIGNPNRVTSTSCNCINGAPNCVSLCQNHSRVGGIPRSRNIRRLVGLVGTSNH